MKSVLITGLAAAAFVVAATTAVAADDLQARVEKASMLKVEKVCEPMRTTQYYNPLYVPNPDGKTYDVLIRYYETYWGPHTVAAIDLGTGAIHKYVEKSALPAQHNFMVGPDGRFYQHWAIPGKGTVLMAYDPGANTWTHALERAPVGGETRPLVAGTDGMVYAGGSLESKACAYQYDPKTGKMTNYGTMGPSHAPNACWGYSIGVDDEYVYMASGKIPWYLVAFNKQTRKDEVLATTDDPEGYIGVSQQRYGCTAMVRGHGKTERFWLYQGKATPIKDVKEKAPWPRPEKETPWVAKPPPAQMGLGRLRPEADGWSELWYRLPGEEHWRAVGYAVPTYPTPIYSIWSLPDGRIAGLGGHYLGNFVYDPATNKVSHAGMIHLSQYCATVCDGKVYMSGYPSSGLFVWDPNASWTTNKSATPLEKPLAENAPNANPRRLLYLNQFAGCHKMWTAATAGDGKVYFGGRWYRNGEGGGLAWWNPQTQKGGGFSEPFTTFQIAYMTTAGDGRYVVMSTICARDQTGKLPTPTDAKVFVFDTQAGKLARDFVPVPKAGISGAIAGVGGPFILGITYDPADRPEKLAPEQIDDYLKERTAAYGLLDKHSILYKANVETGEVLWTKRLPYPVGFCTNENFAHQDGFDFRLGPDGMVWTFTGARHMLVNPKSRWNYAYVNAKVVEDEKAPEGRRLEDMNVALVRIDPQDGAVQVTGKVDNPGEMAFVGRDLYLAGGDKYLIGYNTWLRRIRGIVPE